MLLLHATEHIWNMLPRFGDTVFTFFILVSVPFNLHIPDSNHTRTPQHTHSQALTRVFRAYGAVESVRFRSVAFDSLKLPRKAAFITKKFHAERDTMNGARR